MIIKTQSLTNFSKIILLIKDNINQYYSSLYFSFKDSFIYFYSNQVQGRIKFEYDLDENENIENFKDFFVNTEDFLNVCYYYSELYYDNEQTFYNSKDKKEKFQIENFMDEDFEPFQSSEPLSKNAIAIQLDEDFYYKFVNSLSFISFDSDSPMNGVFIRNNHIITTDLYRLYEATICTTNSLDFAIPYELAKVISFLNIGDKIAIDKLEDRLHVLIGEDKSIELYVADNHNLQLIDVDNQNFVSKYNHDSFIEVDKQAFLKIIKFIDPFTKEVSSQRIKLSLVNDELTISVFMKSNIDRKLLIVNKNKLDDGVEFWMSNEYAKKIFSMLQGDTIRIQVDQQSPAINISSNDVHVVYAKILAS